MYNVQSTVLSDGQKAQMWPQKKLCSGKKNVSENVRIWAVRNYLIKKGSFCFKFEQGLNLVEICYIHIIDNA